MFPRQPASIAAKPPSSPGVLDFLRTGSVLNRVWTALTGLNSWGMATIPDITLGAGLPANLDAERTILGA
ncbi:MAG: hypothetical protein ACLGP3_01045, partial [Acidobacteriota bacterium]